MPIEKSKAQPLLKKGAQGDDVRRLQSLLNQKTRLAKPLKPDGDFGRMTYNAVVAFQNQQKLRPVDGIVGPKTWAALLGAAPVKPDPAFDGPQAKLADIASKYVGIEETPSNKAGDDPILKQIFDADDLVIKEATDGYPWCAAFVSFCVQELLKNNSDFYGVTPPREASVHLFLTKWAKAQKCLVFSPGDKFFTPRKGDILVFKFSHIGIVESVVGNSVVTIEGNTNRKGEREGGAVMRKTRQFGIIRRFIRLPVAC